MHLKSGLFFLLFFSLSLGACLKKVPDAPPDTTGENPNLVANLTIKALKNKIQGQAISDTVIISGVVIMSDKHGNYYKKIVVQDSTGGLEIELDQPYLYKDFPVGRRVFIKCSGLFLGIKNDIFQLGYQPDANGYVSPIPAAMISKFVIGGRYPETLKIDTLAITDLSIPQNVANRINTLVTIKDVQFVDSQIQIPFALSPEEAPSTTRWLTDCNGALLPLQTSGYADFQAIKTPSGKGTITALYTRFKNEPQLLIRDTGDISFFDNRCNQLPAIGHKISILQLRQLYHGTAVDLPNYQISGVVISDRIYKNTPSSSLILQGGNSDAGILIQFQQTINYSHGDSLVISVHEATLHNSYGTLVLKNLPISQIQIISADKTIAPETPTIAQIKANPQSFVSRLVKINNIYWVNPTSTFNGQSGNLAFSDGTDTMSHFCEQEATFRNTLLPPNGASSITGYVFIRNNRIFLKMRNPKAPENDLKP